MTSKRNLIATSSSGGFTLIETAISIAIASGLLVAASGLIKTWIDQSTMAANQQRMATIQQALANYSTQHYRLPCPASYIAQLADVAPKPIFGREFSYPLITGCSGIFPDSTNLFGATNGPRIGGPVVNAGIVIGAVPVRDLGLPDSFIMDTYGHYFTYAVTQSATAGTAAAPMNNALGVIRVLDQNNNDALPAHPAGQTGTGTALYVLVDHGKDGKGAYTGAAAGPSVPCTGGTGLDVYNCSFEPASAPAVPFAFRSAPSGAQPGGSWFDDTIVYFTSFSSTAQSCMTKYGNSTVGLSPEYLQVGTDAGGGLGGGVPYATIFPLPGVGLAPFFFAFVNWFHIDPTVTSGTANYSISPTADAYCPDASFNVVAGGCTQTLGLPIQVPAVTGPVTNPFGGDIDMGSYDALTGGYNSQIALPPLSHPVLPDGTGLHGWECNGSSSSGMYTQAYAICCTGGGG